MEGSGQAPGQEAQVEGRPSGPSGAGGPSPSSCVSSALSIGAGSYAESRAFLPDVAWQWDDLPACASEAGLFAAAAREHLTSDVRQVGAENQGSVPRKTFWRAVNQWIDEMQDETTHLFFDAGHGYEFDGDFFMVPTDSEQPEDDCKLSVIRDKIDRRVVGCRVLFFVSACRDAPAAHPARERPRYYQFECDRESERYRNAALRQNFYLEFFACRPRETVEDIGSGACGPFAVSLAKHLGDKTLSVNELVDKVMIEVSAATGNKEQPCRGSQTVCNFFLHGQPLVASEYSHGLAGPSAAPKPEPRDGHKQWRRRINRPTIQPNIEKPCLVLITDTRGSFDPVVHFNQTGMGPHYVVRIDGSTTQLVDESLAAWCGNPGFWGELEDRAEIPAGGFVNEVHYYAVSIALEGDGTARPFEDVQYRTLVPLLQRVVKDYGIQPWSVLGLSEICMPPGKSGAPGRHFDWSALEHAGLTFGLRQTAMAMAATSSDGGDLRGLMEEYGYCLGGSDSDFDRRLESFCDRYRCSRASAPDVLRALLVLQQRAGRRIRI